MRKKAASATGTPSCSATWKTSGSARNSSASARALDSQTSVSTNSERISSFARSDAQLLLQLLAGERAAVVAEAWWGEQVAQLLLRVVRRLGAFHELGEIVDGISAAGGTPLVVGRVSGLGSAEVAEVLGVIHLKDVVKQGMRDRFDAMRLMGIRTVMITGDNPLTAKAIAQEAGVDDFLAEATPEDKMMLIKREQQGGRLVAMTGDGTNDAPALAQADVGVAMNTGTAAAKEAGNMVDLDSDPTKLIEIVEIGKQLLITRGALTTFSIANDIAKYFAIIPAMFVGLFPGLDLLNVMRLHSPESAILSAVIFNAVVIVALIPLALRGVRYTPSRASKLLSRNLYRYGLGGIVAPFVGIKLIDLLVQLLPGMA